MANVEHHDEPLFFCDAKDYAIDVRFVAEKQVSEFVVLVGYRTSGGIIFQAAEGSREMPVPFQGRARMLGVNIRVDPPKVAHGARQDANLICHARLQIL